MHELAAIIFLVVYEDRHRDEVVAVAAAAERAAGTEAAEIQNKIKLVMDTNYIANDVYTMFSAII